jgi:single-strand DNA-binding protein
MATRSLNKALLIGNLTRDPEIRYTSSGAAVCSFGMATNRSWKDSEGEIREEAEFHNLVSWNKMAEVCYQLLAKGMKVYIEGEIRTRSWDDDEGNTKYRTEVKINEMILLDSKGRTGAGSSPSSADKSPSKSGSSKDDISMDDVDGKAKDEKPKKAEKKAVKKTKKDETEDVGDPLEDDLPF